MYKCGLRYQVHKQAIGRKGGREKRERKEKQRRVKLRFAERGKTIKCESAGKGKLAFV